MEEQINVVITVEASLIIDRAVWPDDWSIKREIAHQMSFSDALECEVKEVIIVEQWSNPTIWPFEMTADEVRLVASLSPRMAKHISEQFGKVVQLEAELTEVMAPPKSADQAHGRLIIAMDQFRGYYRRLGGET